MKIYGVAILAACYLIGQLIGEQMGKIVGVKGNVGGVGFAMIILIFMGGWMKKKGFFGAETEKGILFWNAMYIPVVIAMSATQNVKAALTGGWVALAVGVIGTAISFLMIPVIAKFTKPKTIGNNAQDLQNIE
jgi:malonate transporter MadL subunit